MKLLLAIIILAISASPSFAEQKESEAMTQEEISKINSEEQTRDKPSEVTSHPCPYNCNSAGYSRWGCKEWREGDECHIGPKSDSSEEEK